MMKGLKALYHRKPYLYLFLTLILGVFFFSILRLFDLRFKSGDIYPVYSSLRQDPLGVKALYQSLARFDNLSVKRNYQSGAVDNYRSDTTFLVLGASLYRISFNKDMLGPYLNHLILNGGRLIIAYYPLTSGRFIDRCNTLKQEPSSKTEAKEKTDPKKISDPNISNSNKDRPMSLGHYLGFDICRTPVNVTQSHDPDTRRLNARPDIFAYRLPDKDVKDLPDHVVWHSICGFNHLDPAWKVLYTVNDWPVIVERSFGQGSIVLLSDSYLFSNQAMRNNLYPDLISYTLGPNTHIVFDESHLGIAHQSGIAGLVRKYNLHGMIFGLVVVALLFIWKNAVAFMPPPRLKSSSDSTLFSSHRDYFQGLTSLLRRHIDQGDLFLTCYKEWKKSAPASHNPSDHQFDQIEKIVAQKKRLGSSLGPMLHDPIQLYQTVSNILSKGKK